MKNKMRLTSMVFGVLVILLATVVPAWWAYAVLRNDPDMSSSDAVYVAEYARQHANLTDKQLDVIWEGVNEAHGAKPWLRFVPWFYPPLLIASGLVHIASAIAARKRNKESPERNTQDS